eukprot:c36480_g1_i1 orf=326-520(+)
MCTEILWCERNKSVFHNKNADISEQQALFCMYKITKLLCMWPGKGNEEARRLADRFYETLLEAG